MGVVYDLIGVSRKEFGKISAENKSNNSFLAHRFADRFGLKKGLGGLGKRLSKKSSLIKGSLERFTKFTKKVTRHYQGVIASICMIMVIVSK